MEVVYPTAPDLDQFRFKANTPSDLRESLNKNYGIPNHLVSELYATHAKCRRQLARAELKIYYSLIPRMKRRMREIPLDERRRYWNSTELMSWQNFVRHIDRLEVMLRVTSSRAARLRQHIEKWKQERGAAR